MELCMREKAVFFLPVNILTVWSPAFLAARHTTVCLDVPYLEDSYNAKIVCFGEGAVELCMREKAVFFLPVNILTVWSPAFLAARHTTVCLDIDKRRSFIFTMVKGV